MTPFERHGIHHLSASNINLYVASPAMWCVRYLLKRQTPSSPAAERGKAVEAGIEAALFDPDMPIKDAVALAKETYHTATRLMGHANVEKERDVVADMVEQGVAHLRPLGVPERPPVIGDRQHKIETFFEGINTPFHGFLDLYYPQHGLVVDLKTTLRKPSIMPDAHQRQAAIYGNAKPNHEIRFVYITPKAICEHSLDDLAGQQSEIRKTVAAMERFLSLSDDAEMLTKAMPVDLSSFYWSGAAERAIADEIWQESFIDF